MWPFTIAHFYEFSNNFKRLWWALISFLVHCSSILSSVILIHVMSLYFLNSASFALLPLFYLDLFLNLLFLLLLSCSVRFYLVWDFVMRLSMLILIVCWPKTVPAPPGLVAVPSIRPWIGLQNTLAVSVDVTNYPTAFIVG